MIKLSPGLARGAGGLRKMQGGWIQLIYFIVTLIISIALAPKPPKPKAAALDDFDIPVAEEDRPIPVVFGTCRITGANVVWYGNLSTKKIKQGGLFGSTTIGYKYYLGMHLALGHGPFDAVTKIETADKETWSGNLTSTGDAVIDLPNLYGGERREGGIKGTATVLFGEATQAVNAYLAAQQGSPTPAYRGVTSIVWSDGLGGGGYVGNTPYVKAWAVTCRRILKGWTNDAAWYPAKAAIGGAMNPAHIIYQCLTDLEWGMGAPVSQIDEASFQAAADTMFTENFGLNLLWNQATTIENFVGIVLDHIAGVLAFDQSTGKYLLSLVRADYDPDTLPIFDPSNVISVENFERRSWGETVNELTCTYTDATTRKPTAIVVQDLGNIAAQGVRIPEKVDFTGIDDADLIRTVAGRELGARSTPLARLDLITDRSLWRSIRSDCIRVEWPQHNLPLTVFRILNISRGTLADGKMRVGLVEDIYSLAGIEYSGVQAPPSDPTPPPVDDSADGSATVLANNLSTPPSTPADGDRYYIPASPSATGPWAGHEGQIAEWDEDGDQWLFADVPVGSVIYNEDTGDHFAVDEYGNTGQPPWLSNTLMTTLGDMLRYGTDGPERFAIGAELKVLTVVGGLPVWATVTGPGGVAGAIENAPIKPVLSDFTLENAGTASAADGNYGIVLTMPSATTNARFLRYNAGLPGSSWTMIMRGSMVTPYSTNTVHHNALLLRNSTSGRLINFASAGAQLVVQRWSSYTAFASTIAAVGANYGYMTGWKKITSDGTTLRFYTSPNGADWAEIASEAIATYIGASGSLNQAGMGSLLGSASSVTNVDIFESFDLS